MAPHHAFFALPLLLLGTTTSIRGGNTTCEWAVDSCERSDKDSECKVRLRRWCPCVKRSSWKCGCKTKKKCDSNEFVMVNVSEAREMTRTKLMYATKLENFCNLKTCSTFPQKCAHFEYYEGSYSDFFLEKCCYDFDTLNYLGRSVCSSATKHRWCFLTLCGYHPKPKLKPTATPRNWAAWSENERGTNHEQDYFTSFVVNALLWIGVPLIIGNLVIAFIGLYCKKETNNSSTGAAATAAADKQDRRPLTTMQPQPGEPVPLNRLPDHLKEKLPDPPRQDINIPE